MDHVAIVAPFAGAWIEIRHTTRHVRGSHTVAPFAGAWIEIMIFTQRRTLFMVAPFAGAWIEIKYH